MDLLIKVMADGLVIPVLLLAAYAVLTLPNDKRWQAITRGVVVALTALLFAKFIAQFYQGIRPFETLGVAPRASFLPNPGFPSDHALLVTTATVVTWAATRRKMLSLIVLVLSVLVGLGRVIALVHTPLDIIGGVVCVVLAGLVWYGPRLRQDYYGNQVNKVTGKIKLATRK